MRGPCPTAYDARASHIKLFITHDTFPQNTPEMFCARVSLMNSKADDLTYSALTRY
jgi:hypothetical protein